ncbi:MAG: AAA family ATPase [Clostridiales bacterium]|nr:AAA family ATPase [Clostridiales bacterium]
MDKKDQIILQQLDVIRSMTENSMKRMNSDFWGTPFENVGKEPVTPAAPAAPGKGEEKKNTPPTATAKPGDGKPAEEELPPPEKMEDLMAELDSYIGLGAVKEEVHNLINMVQVYKLRREHDLPTTDMSLHMVFTGNPGTGKTMMARMMARIYRSLGILSKGQLVEVDRSGLVAGYVGQTALKTQKVIEKAMGGVLFVDEAYALNGKSENDFGQEAIDTLLKAMEDHRDDLVVIVAGYTDLMDKFIHSNPGLESRFNRFLLFEDYSLDELMAIFKMRCGKGYTLSPEAEPLVRDYIAEESADGDGFGNARGVRNIFEHILVAQNNRLAKMESVTREDLMTLLPEDVMHARGQIDE